MKTLRQIIEGAVVMSDFKLDRKGRKYKAHRMSMDDNMKEDLNPYNVDMGEAADQETMNAERSKVLAKFIKGATPKNGQVVNNIDTSGEVTESIAMKENAILEGATEIKQQSGSDRAYDVIHKETGKTVGTVYTPGKTNPKHVASVNGSDGRPLKSGEFDSFKEAHNFIKRSRNIDEARGRPAGAATLAKRAAAAAKPREDDDEGEHYDSDSGVEADQHIHVQLKKAADSDQKPFEVSFRNGKKHSVSQKVAKDVLSATERLKPEHRKNVHDEIHQSYDNLMSVHRLIARR